MHEEQSLNQLTDAVLLFLTPGNASVDDTSFVKNEKVRVKRDQYPILGCGKGQLVRVGPAATSCFLGGQQVDPVPPKSVAGRRREMLVHEEPYRLSHRVSPGVR